MCKKAVVKNTIVFCILLHIKKQKSGKDMDRMRETRGIEFKETITNTFFRRVSAFSNYNGGEIGGGIDDAGNIKGVSDIKQACLDIDNIINDSILRNLIIHWKYKIMIKNRAYHRNMKKHREPIERRSKKYQKLYSEKHCKCIVS